MVRRPVTVCGESLSGSAHICAFFDSRDDECSVVVPYYREGLERGDRVIGIVDEGRRAEHLRHLEAEGVPISDALESQQLQVFTPSETYLRNGPFDADEMFATVLDLLVSAKEHGTAVRTCADMDWLSRAQVPATQVMEYESRVNAFTRSFDCTLMCVYDLAEIDGGLMADVMATHPFVIMKGKFRANPNFIEPDTYLQEIVHRRERGRSDERAEQERATAH